VLIVDAVRDEDFEFLSGGSDELLAASSLTEAYRLYADAWERWGKE
jgi:hypothetical protein